VVVSELERAGENVDGNRGAEWGGGENGEEEAGEGGADSGCEA